ncbi:hypothetical protein ACOZDE_15840 [Streptomyces griseoincarnatus]
MAGFCSSYVTWIYNETSNWATWEPGDRVDLGDIGYFDRSLKFTKADTSANLLNTPPHVIQVQKIGSRIHYSSRYFSVSTNASVGTPGAAAEVTFTLKRGEGHVLQTRQGVCEGVDNEASMLDAAKSAIATADWCLAWVLVCERKKVDGGFAAACKGKGTSFTMQASAPVPQGSIADVGFGLGVVKSDGQVNHWGFTQGSTPVFDRVWRVRPDMIDRLYGDNSEWISADRLYYRPGHSRLSPSDVTKMKRSELFETGFSVSSVFTTR